MEPLLLTIPEAARLLGVGLDAARRLVRTGALPSQAAPGSVAGKPQRRVARQDLDAFIASQRAASL